MKMLAPLSLAALLALSGTASAQEYPDEASRFANPYANPGRETSRMYEGRAVAPELMGPGGANTFTNGNMGVGGGPGIRGEGGGGR